MKRLDASSALHDTAASSVVLAILNSSDLVEKVARRNETELVTVLKIVV